MLRAITSTLHLKMKFPTDNGAREVIGYQLTTRRFYNTTLKFPSTKETLSNFEMKQHFNKVGEPIEELEEIPVDESGRKVRIGSEPPQQLNKLESFLRSSRDVFAWTHEDMLGIDPSVIFHQLNLDQTTKPTKQKRQSFALECN